MLSKKEIRAAISAYTDERREMEIANYDREDMGSVVRYTPRDPNADGIVCFARIPESQLDDQIAQQVTYFQNLKLDFEWKVYDFDEPGCLKKRLRDSGFEEGEAQSLMVYDLFHFNSEDGEIQDDVEIRRIENASGIKEVVDLQKSVRNRSYPWLFAHLKATLNHSAIYCAYCDGTAVGIGWIEYPEGSQFAEIHGGAVVREFRGLRIYSRLLEARLEDALNRGLRFVAVDAGPMSRPILERKAFVRLSGTYPLMKRRLTQGLRTNTAGATAGELE